MIRHHSQAVRQRSAKPLFPGPIPGGASKTKARQRRAFVLEDLSNDEKRRSVPGSKQKTACYAVFARRNRPKQAFSEGALDGARENAMRRWRRCLQKQKAPVWELFVLLYFFKVLCAVFAQRADEVFGKLVALVNVTAYLANVPFFAFCLGLRFYV